MYFAYRLYISLLLAVLYFLPGYGQQFGGNPSSLRWRQINTDTIRVIFPAGLDSTAERIAAVTHQLQVKYSHTIGGQIRKVNLVLQNNSTLSNAYVALAPYRSEFYLMPPQNALELGAQNWADNLAIHEFRHVQQYSNFNHGWSKLLSVLFGQDGQAVANAAAVPDWFFEGDAVYNETLLSRQGRGRLPFFFNGYRSLYQAGKQYNFMQLRNGSLRHYIPDHYQLGYLLVAYGREKYGDDFWRNITQDAVRFRPLFYPLQHAVKRYAGVPYTRFVQDALQYYQQQWTKPVVEPQWLTPVERNNVVDYRYPYRTAGGGLIVLKNSYRSIPAFYYISPAGTEQKIAVRDIAYDDYFSFNNGKIVYAAYQADTRWGNREYSNIKVLDIASGRCTTLSFHAKYFSPDIAHNGQMLVATAYTPMQQSSLVILDEAGKPVKQFTAAEGHVFSYPKFAAGDRFVYCMERNREGEMAIRRLEWQTGSWQEILPFGNRITGFPVVQGDTLLYTCSNRGHDETWAYVESRQKHFRLAGYTTGLYQAAGSEGNTVTGSVFTAAGYRLGRFPAAWDATGEGDTLTGLYVHAPFNSPANYTLQQLPGRVFPESKYPKAFRLLNFHSWRPYYSQPELTVAVYGENVLNTLQSQLYYTYNYNEGFSKVGYTGVYGGWYVQPVIGISQTWNRNTLYSRDTSFYWNELNANAGLRLPLDFSAGKQYRYLTLSSTYNVQQVRWTGLAKQSQQNLSFSYLESRLQYTGQIQQATQHIYPRWAQSLVLQYRNILGSYTARQFLASASFYLPGLSSNHNIVLGLAYQGRDTANQYYFSDNFPFSRGYTAIDFPRMWRLSANYHIPLLYPDWGFGNLVYFRRVRLNAFYDYTIGRSLRSAVNTPFHTAGAELYFDTKWWNQQLVSFGVRYSRLLNNEFNGTRRSGVWELILPVNLF
jgi:hypothetical protein